MIIPSTWVEEDREEIVTAITDGIVSTMTLEEMRRMVWDFFYDDLIYQEWVDLWMQAEEYAPELLDEFKVTEEPSH